ncbi:MAG TPA: hypothetical protein VFN57_00065 [Thermomicrobiaceae bacterium]|nr:hypothetical protein [Thermomicrobiaceae bacterium]
MPLMGKDVAIDEHEWLANVGLTEDQFSHVWTYSGGESVPDAGQYREVGSGGLVTLARGATFPDGRWVCETDIPAPRFKLGTDAEEIQGPPAS